jgi:hypothetical protein
MKLTNNNYFYVCPLLKKNEYNKLFMREKYYDANSYKNNNFESDGVKIKNMYSNINKSNTSISQQLCDINLKMICDTRHRYKNIDSIILDLMKIKNTLNYKNNTKNTNNTNNTKNTNNTNNTNNTKITKK